MFEKWLRREDRSAPSAVLAVRMLSTDAAVDADALDAWLGHELFRNYLSPEAVTALELAFDDLGIPEVADHLRRHTFPNRVSVRHGDFGEALGGALFRRVRRYCVPVLKLRYKHRPDQPVQGVDLLAFRLNESPPVVAAPEVKTRTTKRLDIGLDASKSLARVLNDLPSSIRFCAAYLIRQGSFLGARVAKLLDEPFTLERHIVLVHDDGAWDDEIINRLRPVITEQTETTVIRVDNLADVISRAFTAAATDAKRIAERRPASKERSGA